MLPSGATAQNRNRDDWQKVPDILAALGVKEGSWVADVGAGEGYFTVHLGRAVGPQGRVFAVDIDERALRDLRKTVSDNHLSNVEIIRGDLDNPKLPSESLDAVLIVNAYHEMTEYESMLKHIVQALKPGGRLVVSEQIAESRRGTSRATQVDKHELSIGFALTELERAGLVIIEAHDPFLKNPDSEVYWLLVGRRPQTR
ncbi:MAG: class I SAM-dependent methyltransferase [Candidatus Latescibacteria bacterium]|nr:class I SAM-dependent methyltransferase [Candidatus Latescibacterota bacterium]